MNGATMVYCGCPKLDGTLFMAACFPNHKGGMCLYRDRGLDPAFGTMRRALGGRTKSLGLWTANGMHESNKYAENEYKTRYAFCVDPFPPA